MTAAATMTTTGAYKPSAGSVAWRAWRTRKP